MAFLCLSFITVIHAGYILTKDTTAFAWFEVKRELNFIHFLRCVARFLLQMSGIVNGADHYLSSRMAEYVKAQ
jgi:hypothetical protein